MPYPISINKNAIIDLSKDVSYQDIINALSEDLNNVGSEVKIEDNKLKITWCREFSSGVTSFNDYNRGEIKLSLTNQKVEMHFRIYLVEHIVIFLVTLALGAYGIFENGLGSIWLKVATVVLIVNFVFCYLFPLMALNTFTHIFINRKQNK